MTKPTNLAEWGTGSAPIVEPLIAQKQAGWTPAFKPPAQWWNWWMNQVYQWIVWLNAFESTSHTWTALQTYTLSASTCISATNSGGGSPAIQGTGPIGVEGVSNGAASATGVHGTSLINAVSPGYGIDGTGTNAGSGAAYGVRGTGKTAGVWGIAQTALGGAGVLGAGDGAGQGGKFLGGATGSGVYGEGGATSGSGVYGKGGAGGGMGAEFYGIGTTQSGVYGQGSPGGGAYGGYGGQFVGGGTAIGGTAGIGFFAIGGLDVFLGGNYGGDVAGSGPFAAMRLRRSDGANDKAALDCQGAVNLDAAANPATTTAQKNVLTRVSFDKANLIVKCNGTTAPVVLGGENIASVAQDASNGRLTITFAQPFSADIGVAHGYGMLGQCLTASGLYMFSVGAHSVNSIGIDAFFISTSGAGATAATTASLNNQVFDFRFNGEQ